MMTQYLMEIVKSPHIERLFEEVAQGNPKAKKELVEQLADALLPNSLKVDRSKYCQHEPDLRQEFLLKILDGKVIWERARGTLRTYIGTIVHNLWLDLFKQKTPLPGSENIIAHQPDTAQEPSALLQRVRLKSEFACQLTALTCQERIILKMWKPYLGNRSWEADERHVLQEKFAVDAAELLQKLPLELDERLRQSNKPYLSSDWIAAVLAMKRNTIDQILHRMQQKLPWLKGDLRHELE
jgi:DNA-directed RNA polymerase specialized sigma24 family protein